MIKGLIFDLNGTLIDIFTSESDWEIYRTTANFLDYHGVSIAPDRLKEEYFSFCYSPLLSVFNKSKLSWNSNLFNERNKNVHNKNSISCTFGICTEISYKYS